MGLQPVSTILFDFFFGFFPKKLEVIGETYGSCTVAEMLTGDIVESALQGKMLAYVLIHAHLGIEIGWRIGWRKSMATGAPDHVGCQAPASRQ